MLAVVRNVVVVCECVESRADTSLVTWSWLDPFVLSAGRDILGFCVEARVDAVDPLLLSESFVCLSLCLDGFLDNGWERRS